MSETYHDGVHARRHHKKASDNPYPKGTAEHANWATGWRAEDELMSGLEPDKAFQNWAKETG